MFSLFKSSAKPNEAPEPDLSNANGSGVPNGAEGKANGQNRLTVHWRVVDVAPEMFVQVRDKALVDRAQSRAMQTSAGAETDGPFDVPAICDYQFIMSLKAPNHSPLPDPQRPEGLMRHHGLLPLGIELDRELHEQAVYVLVRDREKPLPAPPFLRHDVWSCLVSLLGKRMDGIRHVVLLGTGGRVVDRVVDFFYYQVEIQSEVTAEVAATGEPLSIDVQSDDPLQIAQARYWLRNAVDSRASDIHIEPGDGKGRLRLRIDGEMVKVQDGIPLGDLMQVITWIKAQGRMDISERRRPQDGQVRLSYTQGAARRLIDVRISTIPTIHGQKMVMRLLDPETLQNLAAQGLQTTIPDPVLCRRFTEALSSRDGIVLVTGPTGSGKTTTLNSALFHLLREHGDTRNIVTVEDPVEYTVPGANQTQVNEQAGVTFARTLRSILRQDPDIVLVGEIRDPETAAVAIQAALTGHLILATLHTNDALGSVERLQDLGVSPFLIATTVRLFQAQRLVRTLCPHCGTKRRLTGDDLQRKVAASRLASDAERFWASGVTIYEPAGCPRCEYTGYYGRLAVMEMAVVTPGLVSAIEARLPSRELGEIARQNGYRPMVEQGVDLVCAGRTTLSEVESISLNAFGDGQGNSLSPPKADASSPSLETAREAK